MFNRLQLLFLPNQNNNHKAKVLQLSSLSTLIIIIMAFQVVMTTLSHVFPGVLGYASNVSSYDLVELTNQTRTSQGLSPLTLNNKLVEAARQKANEMFALNYWSHYSPAGKSPWWFFQNVNYSYRYAGENLARDFDQSSNVVSAWMNSPTHRENILNGNYQEIGIAVVDGILEGQETTLVVQMFGTPVNPATTAPAVAEKVQAAQATEEEPATKELILDEEVIPVTSIPSTSSQTAILSQAKRIADPLINTFSATKAVSGLTIGILTVVLTIDALLVYKRKTIRISGRSLAHALFIITLLGMVMFSRQGAIL